MTPAQLIALFRSQSQDVVAPFLWSDDEIISYLNEAQNMLVRIMGGFVDLTSAITTINVTAEDQTAEVSAAILKYVSIYDVTNKRNIAIKNVENLTSDEYVNHVFDPTVGILKYVVTDAQEKTLLLVNPPKEDLTLRLAVHRLPLVAVTTGNLNDDVLEVREEHHTHLLLWMRRAAMLKQDAEVFDKSKAEEFEARFYAYAEQARREQDRREHKNRTTKYGGI